MDKNFYQDIFKRKSFHLFREVLVSSLVLVGLNIVTGLLGLAFPLISIYWAYFAEWESVVSQLLLFVTENQWIHNIVFWIIPPLAFVPFGKKEQAES